MLYEVVPGLLPAVDADDDALRAELSGQLRDQRRVLQRGRVEGNLVGAAVQDLSCPRQRADAAGHAERNVEDTGDAGDPLGRDRAAVTAGGDVVEYQFVGALVAVALGQLDDVADHLVVAELRALDDLAVADVEAGDDAAG